MQPHQVISCSHTRTHHIPFPHCPPQGAFKDWGYSVATAEFRSRVITERESWVLGNLDAGVTDVSANAQVCFGRR